MERIVACVGVLGRGKDCSLGKLHSSGTRIDLMKVDQACLLWGHWFAAKPSSVGLVSSLSLFTLPQEQALEGLLNPQSRYCQLWQKRMWDSLAVTQGENKSWFKWESKRNPSQCLLTWRENSEKTQISIMWCLGNTRTGLSLFQLLHLTAPTQSFLWTDSDEPELDHTVTSFKLPGEPVPHRRVDDL